jgi:hypothetical protein
MAQLGSRQAKHNTTNTVMLIIILLWEPQVSAHCIFCGTWTTILWRQNIIILFVCFSTLPEYQKVVGNLFNVGGILYVQKDIPN